VGVLFGLYPAWRAARRYTLTILRKGADGAWKIARDANLLTAEP
jgi:ketosteroid isomerase-like protein